MNIKKMTALGMLTALYVVLSAFLKFTLIGNIMVDLGYIAFAFALCTFGITGTVVGVLGCAIESILFSAYGFSISWVAANLVIGLICGLMFKEEHVLWVKCFVVVVAVFVGIVGVKTIIECLLYHIPVTVKLSKNAVAFTADSIAMILGVVFYNMIHKETDRLLS